MSGKLKPFSIAGVLDMCPECGATGNYGLLKRRAEAVIAEWASSGGYPDTGDERMRIGRAIADLQASINMEPRR